MMYPFSFQNINNDIITFYFLEFVINLLNIKKKKKSIISHDFLFSTYPNYSNSKLYCLDMGF